MRVSAELLLTPGLPLSVGRNLARRDGGSIRYPNCMTRYSAALLVMKATLLSLYFRCVTS